MNELSENEFLAFVKDGKVLTVNGGGISVVKTVDDHIVKIFRPKSLLSSDIFSPRPLRFQNAVNTLKKLDISTVEDFQLYRASFMNRHVAKYKPLPGEELRNVLRHSTEPKELIIRWTLFLAKLHQKGVYFRGINFSNVVLCPDGQFGLIDIGSIKFFAKSLDVSHRARNFKHPMHYADDRDVLVNFGLQQWIDIYLREAQLSHPEEMRFVTKLKQEHELFNQLIMKD